MCEYFYTVYKITNLINKKIYIGVHQTTNPNDSYMGSGNAIKSAIGKYGKDNFTKSILFEYDNPVDAYLKESQIVTTSFINQQNTYNMMVGGFGGSHGRIVSKETREKLSKAFKGKKLSADRCQKISLGQTGRRNTPKTIKLMSVVKLGKKNPNFKGFWCTPFGKYESSRLMIHPLLSRSTFMSWCINNNNIITESKIKRSQYLQSLNESPIGKTFKDIGFWFESI